MVGKSNDPLTIGDKKQDAPQWKKAFVLDDPQWGIDVPSCRIRAHSPTCGSLMRFFFRKSTTRSYSLMHFSHVSMRGAEIWHIWKQHHLREYCWKMLKSIFPIRSMPLQGDGLYTALLIKILAYLLALRMKARREFSEWTNTQMMRHLSRHHDLRDFMTMHFHDAFSIT